MTIRSSLPGPTTVEYATAAYEWLANPTIRDAVCTSLDQFMLQPSSSTLFTSSYNPPVASYYANYPDPSFFRPNPSEPSSSSSIRCDGTSTSSSTHRGKSSSSTRRGSLKRRSYNPYPSFSASSHSLAHPSNDDFFDNNQYSSSTTLPTTQAALAQAGPSFLVSDPSSPIPMAVSPSPDRYPSSPMMWSPSDEPLFSQDPPNDMFSFNEFAGNLDVSLGPEHRHLSPFRLCQVISHTKYTGLQLRANSCLLLFGCLVRWLWMTTPPFSAPTQPPRPVLARQETSMLS